MAVLGRDATEFVCPVEACRYRMCVACGVECGPGTAVRLGKGVGTDFVAPRLVRLVSQHRLRGERMEGVMNEGTDEDFRVCTGALGK